MEKSNMTSFFRREFTFDRTARIVFLLLLLSFLAALLSGLKSVLIPFGLAWIFAYILLPWVRFIQYKLRVKYRLLSVIIVFLLIAGICTLIVLTIIPTIREEINKTWVLIQQYTNEDSILGILPDNIAKLLTNNANIGEFLQDISPENIFEGGRQIMDQLSGLVSGTISVMSWATVFTMGLIYFFFILVDYESLIHGLIGLFPLNIRRTATMALSDVDYYMNNYFRGQAMVALSVGVLLAIGYRIMGLPLGITIGLFIGMLNFIPYMQILGILPLTFLAGLSAAQTGSNFFVVWAITLGILMLVQIIQDTVLVPHIMGRQMGMRPSLILLCITIWGTLLGFFGLIIALPITMTIYSFYMRLVVKDPSYIDAHKEDRNDKRKRRRIRRAKRMKRESTDAIAS
ncbi:AI-2E family transporter [Porphyromonas crevioricanis]|nr:AI-2E family transporter [Porphyromonas crevioricanis]